MPEDSLKNDIYLNNVQTVEALSESTIQLAINGRVTKQFGFESNIQIISGFISLFSIYKCMAVRYAFVQYNKDPGLSKNFFCSLLLWFYPILCMTLLVSVTWFDRWTPSILLILHLMFLHPMPLYILTSSQKFFNKYDVLHLFNGILIIYYSGLHISYILARYISGIQVSHNHFDFMKCIVSF